MLKGIVVDAERAPGGGKIEPQEGGEPAFFNPAELTFELNREDVVTYETARSAPKSQGLQAVNIRVVK